MAFKKEKKASSSFHYKDIAQKWVFGKSFPTLALVSEITFKSRNEFRQIPTDLKHSALGKALSLI